MSSVSEPRVTAENVTLENCDREQIQYANAIQPHAVLLVVSEHDEIVIQASANIVELGLGEHAGIVGRRLNTILPASAATQFAEWTPRLKPSAAPRHLFSVDLGGEKRDVLAHRIDGSYILEFERQSSEDSAARTRLYAELQNGISQLNATTSVVEFLDEAVHVIANCTGFERVMAYRFASDGSGEVVAEAVHPGLDRYLGLHYPASDIPKPARRLFSLTWLRHLPDVDYQPISLLPAINPITNDAVDLSYAFSRSVSVMYSEYLHNMGVKATMVLTLFKAGRLWGLISCMQHSAPHHLNIEVRGICEMLAQMISLLMSAKEEAEFAAYRASLVSSLERLNHQLALQPSIVEALTADDTTVLTSIDAAGAAVLLNGELAVLGQTPAESLIRELAHHIGPNLKDTWSTDMLARELDVSAENVALAAGVLAARVGHNETDLVLWFRPEYRHGVNWAGDPSKLVVRATGRETRLHPNGSFDVWRSEAVGRAKPWLDCELDFAEKLGRGILDVVAQRSREFARLNQDLSRSNRELEDFVYTASHDLKTPLRGIAGQVQLLLRGPGKLMEQPDRERLEGILGLARRMNGVIEGLLRYSELGHAALSPEHIDLSEACSHAVEMLQPEIERRHAEIRMPRKLPGCYCDARWVEQIYLNLIGNALKYNDKEHPWVEIGYLDAAPDGSAKSLRTRHTYYVRDNGIGIPRQHAESVFRLFHRLHSENEYGGGTGLGLSIVARSVERHGGRLWLDSEPGVGTTFYFTLDPETI